MRPTKTRGARIVSERPSPPTLEVPHHWRSRFGSSQSARHGPKEHFGIWVELRSQLSLDMAGLEPEGSVLVMGAKINLAALNRNDALHKDHPEG